MIDDLDDFELTSKFQDGLIVHATGSLIDPDFYMLARRRLLKNASIRHLVPDFVGQHRSTDSFWQWIKLEKPSYAERRVLIYSAFGPLLDHLELGNSNPAINSTHVIIEALSKEQVEAAWTKATERRTSDPEGAITMSRTLLESVCKHILDDLGVDYSEKDDLRKLYGLTASQLKLAPEDHGEEIFKQILGGCRSVVQGLGSLRNNFSDAHGKSRKGYKPDVRHASLAVNLAGTVATFLLETHMHLSKSKG